MTRRVACAAIVVLACSCGGERQGRRSLGITGGAPHSGHPAVAELELVDSSGQVFGSCTASLIGQRTVLTAAHCVEDGLTASLVRFDSGEEVGVQSTAVHPAYKQVPIGDWHDFAVLRLARSPSTVTAHAIAAEPPEKGMAVTFVGYGSTMCTLDKQGEQHCTEDSGTKRIATNTINTLTQTELLYTGKGSTCAGDSGGPVFASYQGREVQIGVTSRGERPCGSGYGYAGRPDAVLPWIRQVAENDVVVDEGADAPEDPPSQAGALGAPCTAHAECQSGVCLDQEGARFCTAFCDTTIGCGAGYECAATSDPTKQVCTRSASTTGPADDPNAGEGVQIVGSCTLGGAPGGAPSAAPWLWLALLAAALLRRR